MFDLKPIHWAGLSTEQQRRLLQRPVFSNEGLTDSVRHIIERVREGGDDAVIAMTREFDGVEPSTYLRSTDSLDSAVDAAGSALIAAMQDAGERIRAFHTGIKRSRLHRA